MGTPFQLIPLGHVALAARAWRHRGQQLLTVIVKGTFDVRPDAAMTVAPPLPIVAEGRHFQNDPIGSLLRASDLALVMPRPEVVIVGAAHAGRGRRAASLQVRLAVQQDRTVLFDKRLEIVGDRRAAPGASLPAPTPFERMPIQYERAFGGMAMPENPVGRGATPDADGLVSHPNVFLAQGGGIAPAGFGPIPSSWAVRRARRGTLSAAAAESASDIEVPADFDEAYFQTAPPDQRTHELLGGELVTMLNMHPEYEVLRTYLPALRGVAMLQTARGDRVPVALRLDTVHLEPETLRAEVLYRGVIPVSADQLAQARIAGAFEAREHPFTFPDLASLRGATPSAPPPPPGPAHASTMLIEPSAPPAAGHFKGTMLLEVDAPSPKGTMVLELDAPPPRPAPPAPPPPAPRPAPPGPPRPTHSPTVILALEPETKRLDSTMIADVEAPPSMPFDRAARDAVGKGQPPPSSTTKVATPWAPQKPASVITATGITSTLLDVDDEPPPAPPQTAPAPQVPAPRGPEKSPWREDPSAAREAPPPPPPAAKVVLPPRNDLKGSLYKKAKR